MVDAVGDTGIGSGAERGFCDRGDAGAEGLAAGLLGAGVGITGGTCGSVLSVEGGDGLPGHAMKGAFASDGVVDDELFGDETAGASRDIANGEI